MHRDPRERKRTGLKAEWGWLLCAGWWDGCTHWPAETHSWSTHTHTQRVWISTESFTAHPVIKPFLMRCETFGWRIVFSSHYKLEQCSVRKQSQYNFSSSAADLLSFLNTAFVECSDFPGPLNYPQCTSLCWIPITSNTHWNTFIHFRWSCFVFYHSWITFIQLALHLLAQC